MRKGYRYSAALCSSDARQASEDLHFLYEGEWVPVYGTGWTPWSWRSAIKADEDALTEGYAE